MSKAKEEKTESPKIFLDKEEIGLIRTVLIYKPDGNIQVWNIDEIDIAGKINNMIKVFIDKDNQFTDGVFTFTTEEKAFILKEIKRPWNVDVYNSYKSLIGKLN